MKTIKETNQLTGAMIIEVKEERDKLAGRIDVLEKVKDLLLLPNSEYATSKQVAEYYQVKPDYLRVIYQRHRKELFADGVTVLKGSGVSELKGSYQNDTRLEELGLGKHVTTISLYPKRAILRIGMVLDKSVVAQEVRSRLLNVVERAEEEVRVEASVINKEVMEKAEKFDALKGDLPDGIALSYENIIEYERQQRELSRIKAERLEKEMQEEKERRIAVEQLKAELEKDFDGKIIGMSRILENAEKRAQEFEQDAIQWNRYTKSDQGVPLSSVIRRLYPNATYNNVLSAMQKAGLVQKKKKGGHYPAIKGYDHMFYNVPFRVHDGAVPTWTLYITPSGEIEMKNKLDEQFIYNPNYEYEDWMRNK
ncbi:hypothetical protein [Bacillus toyonensis]|uniref:hypothetical protein n=1 Tax=Bacillus toyonensis TaxID=155322 RepID=UPI000BFBBAA1|nr:hypothetical protein [Bacillus toyonensis]PHB28876.1 hypothetical protein COE88_02580 [Bacillus toyonensis]